MSNPIILALDFPELAQADAILEKVRPNIGMIKIGLELFTSEGWHCLDLVNNYNIPIFLDLKLHDIPNTVARTIDTVCRKLAYVKGEHFLSIHCLGGKEMVTQALKVADGSNVKLAGITFLTSIEREDLWDMGYKDTRVGNQTAWVADIGHKVGMTHFVCAPTQLSLMRKHYPNAVLITPGIRAEGEDTQDHKRSKPASFALKNKANWLVVGRPITQALDPEGESLRFARVAEAYCNY